MTDVERLAAIEAIKQAKARYFRGVDTGDGDLVRDVLAEDCVLDYMGCCTDPTTGQDFLPAMNVVMQGAASWSSEGLRALGIVSVVAIPGQLGLGALSDRIGREWIWTAGCAGFAICYIALIALEHAPSIALLYVMVVSQGFLGYALTSVMGPIVAEIFEGPHYGTIFGTIAMALTSGGAAGPSWTRSKSPAGRPPARSSSPASPSSSPCSA